MGPEVPGGPASDVPTAIAATRSPAAAAAKPKRIVRSYGYWLLGWSRACEPVGELLPGHGEVGAVGVDERRNGPAESGASDQSEDHAFPVRCPGWLYRTSEGRCVVRDLLEHRPVRVDREEVGRFLGMTP